MSDARSEAETPEDRDALAGEYVLGLVEGADLVATARREETDPDFAQRVESWRRYLLAIDMTARPSPPPPGLWGRIEADLGAIARLSPVPVREQASAWRDWWRSLPLWRSAALAGALASLLLAVGLVAALERARRQPQMVAVLLTDANAVAAVVNTFADGRVEMLPLQAIPVPPGRALEIWTLWDKAVGPRSVGLIREARSERLRLDDLPLGTGQLFEITLEPETGSPTGRPTGPIIAKGTTAQAL